jgi:hypothetical protein
MGVLGAALVLGMLLLMLALSGGGPVPPPLAATPDAGARNPQAVAAPFVSTTLTDSHGRPLLSNQSEQKRNQILVVDLFHEILARYPNLKEQSLWFDVSSPANQALQQMRRRGASDAEIANYIAGLLMESPERKGQMPVIRWPLNQLKRPGMDLSDGAAVVGAMLARAVGYRDEVPRASDAQLVETLAKEFGLDKPSDRSLYPVQRMMQAVSGSSDVNEHFLDADTNLHADTNLEVEAMKVALRRGRLLVLFGSDAPLSYRFIAVAAFDARGDFLVRDPFGRLPERLSPVALLAFLLKPGKSARDSRSYWLDMPGERRGPRCPPPGQPLVALADEPPPELVQLNEGAEFSGVIPGAQVNLEKLRIPPGEHTMRGSLSLRADQIDEVLTRAGSPAAGTGASWVKWGSFYNIDPAYGLAFFRRESVFGTHKRWIGRMPNGDTSKNVGNIRYRGAPNPQRDPQYSVFNGFRAYSNWDDGIHDWFKLLAQDANYAGLHTVEQILPKYAPAFENDTDNYMREVVGWVKEWRTQYGSSPRMVAPAVPERPTVQNQLARYAADCPP